MSVPEKRFTNSGPNTLCKEMEELFLEELLGELEELMIILLFVAGVFCGIIGGLEDAIVVALLLMNLLY